MSATVACNEADGLRKAGRVARPTCGELREE